MTRAIRILALALSIGIAPPSGLLAQEIEVERPEPPPLEDFETDANQDGVPDGWYNLRDAELVDSGGVEGPHCLKFATDKPGRPARISRIFGVDSRKYEAVVIGLWVRAEGIKAGERHGEDPGLVIDFIGDQLRATGRGLMGPWTRTVGTPWTRLAKRFPVPRGTNEAIMSLGLIGATGTLEVDGLTIDLVPLGGTSTNNLVNNGDFELGDSAPSGWIVEYGAHRATPGFRSSSALELTRPRSRGLIGLGMSVEAFSALEIRVMARAQGLRGAGGAAAAFFFLDNGGRVIPGSLAGVPVLRWSGSFDWRPDRVVVPVPRGAVRAVFQIEKSDANGSIRFDDITITASPDPDVGSWTPYHIEDETTDWMPVRPSTEIVAGSALDVSSLLDAPAGKHGFVTVRDGRLGFTNGGRARFFGVSLLPPTAFLESDMADRLADRLARSGINLVRLGDLDVPLGPERSLFDDTRDDTRALDPLALARLDHLIAALKSRGIYVAIELQAARRFRAGDEVDDFGLLPAGGGPAAAFDPTIGRLAFEAAQALLGHVNPETGLALRDEPALAWVTLAGEVSLFDQIDTPEALPPRHASALRSLVQKSTFGPGRRFWEATESAHWKGLADLLRRDGLKVPIAGVSHWRREPEFSATQAAKGLDLVDDRLYWSAPPWISPDRRSLLWSLNGGLVAGASRKRKADRPYVVGQWCQQTQGAWADPYEAADVLLASLTASTEDWDALVRRGLFLHPAAWGSGASGTSGGEDIFQVPQAANGIPQVFALWPHAASLMLRDHSGTDSTTPGQAHPHPPTRHRRPGISGWEPARGRLVIDTPHTQGLAGWPSGEPANFEHLAIETNDTFAVVVATSVGPEPIAEGKRLLISAIARIEPTGFRWVDHWKRDVADPGRPPLLQEPVRARVRWRHEGSVKAFALDNNGTRLTPVEIKVGSEGAELEIDGRSPTLHWELVAE